MVMAELTAFVKYQVVPTGLPWDQMGVSMCATTVVRLVVHFAMVTGICGIRNRVHIVVVAFKPLTL
jgi:apolipoprotein N-acyltransferase